VSYPTPISDANLGAIRALATLGCTAGYSDHTLGIEAAVLSVALGARVIEKHFTLDKNLSEFRDHQLSADPDELAELARRVRDAEELVGSGTKRVMPAEESSLVGARRSIMAARDLPAGLVVSRADLTWLRPGGFLRPGQEGEIEGRRLTVAVRRGEPILLEHLA
jgi:N-acetylneuraminate synthase/N,N'-diacetyllegionaminate synthase